MEDLILQGARIELPSTLRVTRDRRHPVRSDFKGPALSPLLRPAMPQGSGQVDDVPVTPTEPSKLGYVDDLLEEPHDLAAAKGIFLALLMSIPFWIVMMAVVMLTIY